MLSTALLVVAGAICVATAVRRFGLFSFPAFLTYSAIIFGVLPATLTWIEAALGVERDWIQTALRGTPRHEFLLGQVAEYCRLAVAVSLLLAAGVIRFGAPQRRADLRNLRELTPRAARIHRRLAVLLVAGGLTSLAIRIGTHGGLGAFLDTPFFERHTASTAMQYVGLLEAGIPAGFLLWLTGFTRRGGVPGTLRFLASLGVAIALVSLQGARIHGLMVFVAATVLAAVQRRKLEAQLYTVGLGCLLVALMGFVLVRGALDRHTVGSTVETMVDTMEREGPVGMMELGLELGNYEWHLAIARDVPGLYPPQNGAAYARLFTIPIPRSLWSGKPVSTNVVVAQMFHPDKKGLSLNSTLWGEAHLNFGYWGQALAVPVLFWFWLAVWRMLFRARTELQPGIQILLLNYGFIAFRSELVTPLLAASVPIAMIIGLDRLLRPDPDTRPPGAPPPFPRRFRGAR